MKTPEEIHHVSQTQLSIARHYGGITYNGASYHYDESTDRLIRMDIWRARLASDKKEAARWAKEEREKWIALKKQMQSGFTGF